uniref:Uncharacterized protein n=1 Tax=Sphaerodactylus townsendi TaxID=933632 RepID=A0ACB8FTF0_9SAUR
MRKRSACPQWIRQGTRSVADFVSEFRQLAAVIQDWLELVKIHFFKEWLHPKVAQWALVTAEPTSLAGGKVKKAGAASRVVKKPPFKKGMELQVEPCEASSASAEAGNMESSDELAGNDSNVA